jgi:2-polyprenyl-3-methyl-5-hydroxy-6-metoxy-1,4-benzoquinol methylase
MTFEKNAFVDILFFPLPALDGTGEFELGVRELRQRLPSGCRWHMAPVDKSMTVSGILDMTESPWVLVILDSAILISDNLLGELLAVAELQGTRCVLPADPRGFNPGVVLDYASRPGFDRFVERLHEGFRLAPYDGRTPWVYLVSRAALMELHSDALGKEVSWVSLPARLGEKTVIAHHAFIHSYANYHSNTRAEMLRILPENVRSLLDVGGGTGNFAFTFMAERGGRATLLELNPRAVEEARERGIKVIVGDFGSVAPSERFDCVAMLDVLEHMSDPLTALVHARQFIQSGGALLLSLPNVGHWSVVWDLLEGKFDYQPVGILCNTHLRFFTRYGLEKLLDEAGFRVEHWVNVASPPPATFAAFLDRASGLSGKGGVLPQQGVKLDNESLATESFHVLARRD